jgi:hypothetical protein
MHTGSCHCGDVGFTVQGGAVEQAIECHCSYCRRKGSLLWFVPQEALAITSGESGLIPYTFNTRTIRHLICANCGCEAFALGQKPDGNKVAAINIRCLDAVDLAAIQRVAVNGPPGGCG